MQRPGPVVQQPSLWASFSAWHASLPLWTGTVFAVCCCLSVLGFVLGIQTPSVCLSPYLVLRGVQFWRLFTAPLFHIGFMHVALNMMAWTQLGPSLERLVGTLQFVWLTLVFAALGGLLHSLAGVSGGSHECAVGLSGVIFSLVVVDSHLTPTATRTLFGIVNVSTRWYPLALLAALQLLLPSASVLGHLAGVLVGYAYCWGYLNWAVLSPTAVNTLERARCLAAVVSRPNVVLATGLPDPHGGGLPRWITAPGGDSPGLRMPGWLHRTVAQAQAAVGVAPSPGSGPSNSGGGGAASFNGRSRTLGGREGHGEVLPAVMPQPPSAVHPVTHVHAAAVSATEARARAARAAEARLMQTAGGGHSPPAASAVASAASGVLPTGQTRLDATPPGLAQLVAMEFDEALARDALVATHGDLSAAIERLVPRADLH
jgi:membrane associated rhomboid family serine protease